MALVNKLIHRVTNGFAMEVAVMGVVVLFLIIVPKDISVIAIALKQVVQVELRLV
jgi:hypothetical protein